MKKLLTILLTLALGMSAAALTLDNAEAAN